MDKVEYDEFIHQLKKVSQHLKTATYYTNRAVGELDKMFIDFGLRQEEENNAREDR